jgi:beta-mannosidase
MTINLASRRWKLQGWRPHYWEMRRSSETKNRFVPEFGPYPAVVPGSVHTALRQAKEIADWNKGRSSLACEWIEHRHWEFFTEFRAGELPSGVPLFLHADGLDYSGWILVDDKIVATFHGALIRHCFDLSKALGDGKAHRLAIVFDLPPEEQGQIGRTSLSRFFKPRYSFSWDWCVRLVPVGIWDRIALVSGPRPIEVIRVTTVTSADRKSGEVVARIRNGGKRRIKVELLLRRTDGKIAGRLTASVASGEHTERLSLQRPRLWWPNGTGDPYLYDLEIREVLGAKNTLFRSRVGFKYVRWLRCKDAPRDARPLVCEVNGRPIFLQGVNWTPVELDYLGTPDSAYRRLVGLYQDMGCNVLRVWGGGFIEKEIFYRLCDEAGLLVWQEFPLSSSGLDNDAPRNPEAIATLEKIATDYVRRRGHHASLLTWCGGNELQAPPAYPGGPSRPLDETHPALAMLRRVVKRENPGVRFFPTSPSGPVFYALREKMGHGVHHHVHGPWESSTPEKSWRDYWLHDDSLLRSETGAAGASGVAALKRYAGDQTIWPPSFDNPWWRHNATWWLQWNLLKNKVGKVPASRRLALYVALSQERQARFLALAAGRCKQRFPGCAGFIVWMGHDSCPAPSNTSIIDFDQKPKLAYAALRKVFRSTVSPAGPLD